ncbi:fatty acid desaturase [Luteimonas sp. TWI1416]|uniref:fatty acid desaturase family protein n=1 Tax=unclassified Luteimonas TaxID=2629088 RepID=UPI0032097DB4
MKKPAIPASFRRISNLMGIYSIVHGLLIWIGCSQLALWVYHFEAWPLPLRLSADAFLIIAAGMGMFLLGSLGHEGFHGNLNRSRKLSMLMGIVASTAVPTFCSVGLNAYHWRHHAKTNTHEDPDFGLYGQRQGLASKSIGPMLTSAYCMRNTARLLNGSETLERGFPFSVLEMRRFAWFNVSVVGIVTAAWVYLLVRDAEAFIFTLALPALVGQVYWTLHPYIEHADTGVSPRDNARDCTSPILQFLLLGYTFHHCHHLFPSVPAHRLPALRRYLEASGYLNDETPVQRSLVGALRVGVMRTIGGPR